MSPMPAWLVPVSQARSSELLTEFLRLLGASRAEPVKAYGRACEILCRLVDADGAALCALESGEGGLRSLAASAPEWEWRGPLDLRLLPGARQALQQGEALWIEEGRTEAAVLPLPLQLARRFLLVPVGSGTPARKCFLLFHAASAASPSAEEMEAVIACSQACACLLEVERLQQSAQAALRRQEDRTRLQEEVRNCGFTPAGLQRLLHALLRSEEATTVGLYRLQGQSWHRLAAGGEKEFLPAELPRTPAELPWERAREENQAVEIESSAGAGSLEACLPLLSQQGLPLRVEPLGAGVEEDACLLLGGARAARRARGGDGVRELALWLAAALEIESGRRLQEDARRRYRALFEHVPEGVLFLDSQGVVAGANRRMLELTGYAREEVEGRSAADFLDDADWGPMARWLAHPAAPYAAQVRWRHPGGRWAELGLRLHPAPAAGEQSAFFVGFLREPASSAVPLATPLRDVRLRGVIDSVHDGVWLLDAEGVVLLANSRLAQLFGVGLQELGPGLPQRELLEGLKNRFRSADEALVSWERLAATPEEVRWDEVELVLPRRRLLERFARPLFGAEDRLVGRLEIYRDITARRLLEGKVMQRERLAVLGQLMAGVAHELNNPLTAVAGYAELLQGTALRAEVREKARWLSEEAARASRIVHNLLAFARGEKGPKQQIDLAQVLERTLALRAYELKIKNIRVVRELEANLPAVFGDAHQLQQVFLNLLLNAEQAIQYQRRHGRILLRASADADRVRVEISDSGPGIPAAVLPFIFDPFFTTKPASEGTGLGLSIAQAIVQEHRGDILVQSTAGRGATFVVELPAGAARPAEAPAAAPGAEERATSAAGGGRRRILVVDDEPYVAQLIHDALRQQGHTVVIHTEGRAALQAALEEPFDLAICDLRMPDLDGPGFYRALEQRSHPLARRLVFTTGDTLSRDSREFLGTVHLPQLPKPFHVEQLRQTVERLLRVLDQHPADGLSADD